MSRVIIKADRVAEINKGLQSRLYPITSNVPMISLGNRGSNTDTDNVQNGVWVVCHLDELSEMIRELTALRDEIAEQTGVIL